MTDVEEQDLLGRILGVILLPGTLPEAFRPHFGGIIAAESPRWLFSLAAPGTSLLSADSVRG